MNECPPEKAKRSAQIENSSLGVRVNSAVPARGRPHPLTFCILSTVYHLTVSKTKRLSCGRLRSDSQTVTGFRRCLVRVAAKDVVVLPSPKEAIPALTGEALSTRALAGAPLSAAFSEASSSAACS